MVGAVSFGTVLRTLFACGLVGLTGCASSNAPPPKRAVPCLQIPANTEIRAADAKKMLDELVARIELAPEDAALRNPKSLADVRAILRRDTVYLFGPAAAYARSLGTLDGRFEEAMLELLFGESELIASQILSTQEAWLGGELRIARANVATEGTEPTTDRGRLLTQLIRLVEEGNKIADALGAVAPGHLARGAELVRQLRKEAPADPRTLALVAEYHRARGEWNEFDAALQAAEANDRSSPRLCYLRAIEPLERERRPDLGAEKLRACRKQYPKSVRLQAGLVLVATNPEDALREIDQLKALNEDHYLVMLLEPTLTADRELTRMKQSTPRRAP